MAGRETRSFSSHRQFILAFIVSFVFLLPGANGGPVVMERDWLPATTGSEPLRLYLADAAPHDYELALAGNLPVLWRGHLIPTQTAIDPRFSNRLYLEFTVPPHLRTPGLIRFTLWDAASQRQTAHFGRVAVIFPTDSEVFEASPENDRFVVYNAAEGAEDGGRIDIYGLSSGALADTVPLAPSQRALAFTPDAIFAWLADDVTQGRLVRMNLWTREIDRTIQITLPSPPFESIQVQVDRENLELLVVRAARSSVDATVVAYLESKRLPGAAPFPSQLPLSIDDRGRYLIGNQACNLNPSSGFTGCVGLPSYDISALWADKYANGGGVYELGSGARLLEASASKAFRLAASRRLLFVQVYGSAWIVDDRSLETWAEIVPENDGWRLLDVNRVWSPDWILGSGWFPDESTESQGTYGVLATRMPELAAAPTTSEQAIVHGAAFSPGGIAPGQIVSIFGENLGIEGGSLLTWEGTLELAAELDGVSVIFSGYAGTMLYAGPTQINVVAPEGIQGLQNVEIQVTRYGIPSARITLPVVSARPGLFAYVTANRRYAAALHLDGTVQGPSAPLERGAPVSLFGTGLGLPPGLQANRIADRAADTPIQPKVTIGGRPAQVLYSGTSPGLTAGLAQINVIVPPDAPVGAAVEVVIEAQGRTERNTWLSIR